MTLPFQPPPGLFPGANILLTPPDAALFQPMRVANFWRTWDQQYYALYPIIGGSIDDVGHIIHVWKTPWSNSDGWAVIDGYSQQNGDYVYTILGLDLPSSEGDYNFTIGDPPDFNIHTLWHHLTHWPIGPLAGAIRWGKLWFAMDLTIVTHNTDICHFDGSPPGT